MKAGSAASAHGNAPVRGTQLLVEHMSEVFRRPSLVAVEIAWRWLVGIPFLLICWHQGQQILQEIALIELDADLVDPRRTAITSHVAEGFVQER